MTDLAGAKIVLRREQEAGDGLVRNHQAALGQAHVDERRDAAEEREQQPLLLDRPDIGISRPGLIRTVCPRRNRSVRWVSKWVRAAERSSALMVSHQN